MADASDSKSDVGDYVRVQVPPSAVETPKKKEEETLNGGNCIIQCFFD